MMVPAGAGELDEAHAFFRETTRHEALRAKALGVAIVEAVEFANVRGFLVEIEHVGHAGLHFVGEFVTLNDAFELGIAWIAREQPAIGFLDEFDLLALLRVAEPAIREIGNAAAGGAESRALEARGQKRTSVVHRAAGIGHGIDGDKARQVLRLGAEAVNDPRAH